jgi:hypothetical protein
VLTGILGVEIEDVPCKHWVVGAFRRLATRKLACRERRMIAQPWRSCNACAGQKRAVGTSGPLVGPRHARAVVSIRGIVGGPPASCDAESQQV